MTSHDNDITLDALGLHVERVELAFQQERACPACGKGCLCIDGYSAPIDREDRSAAWAVYIDCDSCDASASGEGATLAEAALRALSSFEDSFPDCGDEEVF